MSRTVRVLMLGGSVFARERVDIEYLEGFAGVVQERLACNERVLVVTGGGRPAREWIEAARAAGETDEAVLDAIGIQATRLNAALVASVLHTRLSPEVALDIRPTVEETAEHLKDHQVAVMGGTSPGHSTDHVAATLATAAGADHLYILTNVDGVFTADPNEDPQAQILPELTSSRLVQLVGDPRWTAGRSGVVDPAAARHVHEARLPVTVLNGRDLVALAQDMGGRRTAGSIVHPDRRE